MDLVAACQSLIAWQAKYTKNYDKARQAKTQQSLVIGEEVYFLSVKYKWQICTVTGSRDTGRNYDILSGEGTSLRRNRSHLKPRSFDIPIILQYFNSRTSTLSQSEITRNVISGLQLPPKVKYFTITAIISFQNQLILNTLPK